PDGRLVLDMPPSEKESLKACTAMILERLGEAKSPTFLLDLDAVRFGLSDLIMKLADRFDMQIATLNCAKGAVPETSSRFVGTYAGIASAAATRAAVEQSDCLVTIGYRRIEATTGFFTDKLPASTIHVQSTYVELPNETHQGVYVR